MILTAKQIEEIERWYHESPRRNNLELRDLLETVKALRKENDKQMELLEAARRIMRHWEVGHELQNQIEEHLK